MEEELSEARAIAQMIGVDGHRVVGWVYRWNTGALTIRWASQGPQRVADLRPDLGDAEKEEIGFDRLTRLSASGE
jgi:hypothetical protein